MKKNLFQEYIDSKKKLKKPVVDPTGDQIDPKTMPNKPPKAAKKYKCSDGKPKTANGKEWGSLGDKSLVYEPDVKNTHGCKPAKIPTAEQIKIANAMADDIQFDPTLLETVVRVLNKRGLLGALVAETFEHKESCSHLSTILSHGTYGPKLHRNLKKVLSEESADPYADQLQGEEDEEEEEEDPFADEDEGDDDEEGDDEEGAPPMPGMDQMDPSMGGMDPNAMMGGQMGGMDPTMMGGMDPNAMGGMDPSMMGGMDPAMMGGMPQPPIMPQPQMQQPPVMPMMMSRFQKAYQKAMMRKR